MKVSAKWSQFDFSILLLIACAILSGPISLNPPKYFLSFVYPLLSGNGRLSNMSMLDSIECYCTCDINAF